jgi:hypothetical protein
VLFRRRKPYAQDLTFYPAKNQQEKQEQIETHIPQIGVKFSTNSKK